MQQSLLFDKTVFAQRLLHWFSLNQRPLPWRKTYAPYEVWVSEVMLQQTQMERVVDYFNRWMQLFPTVNHLADAPEDVLLKAWEGLGYYSRARNIHLAAKKIVTDYASVFPNTMQALLDLPGVGQYTAAAVASIAFRQNIPVVDANVIRVLSRVANIDTNCRQNPAKSCMEQMAHELLPQGKARDYNQALMEFGALVCSKKPLCEQCCIQQLCAAHKHNVQQQRPVLPPKPATVKIQMVTGVLEHPQKKGVYFVQKRLDTDVWGGLWEFPGGCLEEGETPEQALIREYAEETGFCIKPVQKVMSIQHTHTKYKITLHCFTCVLQNKGTEKNVVYLEPKLTAASEYMWADVKKLAQLAYPAGHKQFIMKYFFDDLYF